MFRQLRRTDPGGPAEQDGGQHTIWLLPQDAAAQDLDGQRQSLSGLGE